MGREPARRVTLDLPNAQRPAKCRLRTHAGRLRRSRGGVAASDRQASGHQRAHREHAGGWQRPRLRHCLVGPRSPPRRCSASQLRARAPRRQARSVGRHGSAIRGASALGVGGASRAIGARDGARGRRGAVGRLGRHHSVPRRRRAAPARAAEQEPRPAACSAALDAAQRGGALDITGFARPGGHGAHAIAETGGGLCGRGRRSHLSPCN